MDFFDNISLGERIVVQRRLPNGAILNQVLAVAQITDELRGSNLISLVVLQDGTAFRRGEWPIDGQKENVA